MSKRIEKMPPEIADGNKDLREICEYLAYLREQINYLLTLQDRKIDEIGKSGGEKV